MLPNPKVGKPKPTSLINFNPFVTKTNLNFVNLLKLSSSFDKTPQFRTKMRKK